MSSLSLSLADEAATVELGARIARALPSVSLESAWRVHLHGDLGAGKTTLVRGVVRALGGRGAVRSPTYSLLETYALPPWEVLHLDLYRLAGPAELQALGLADFDRPGALWLIEWPERLGGGPPADLEVWLHAEREGHRASLQAGTLRAESLVQRIATSYELSPTGH
ncbi:MAG: tRNA (adenosine(37)-N6)-threonylcarbamoyltransferase complex ATPase subunit type 1 TsaE [Sinobacteraceae bacterium]|nr:tRNA (adenosine(37)-N6)-threonylcarbamoyltransferase complex ATPase subunit type 1 TsaE [Nevskiaceae bacterium]